MSLATSAARFCQAFRNRDYSIYCIGSSLTVIGLWMQRIAIGWVTWQLTESPTWLGIISFAELFPVVILSPFAGALADRADRLTIARVAQCLNMAQATILTILTLTGTLNIWLLLALALWTGVVVSFWQPARMAMIPNLVRREDLASAVAINSVIFNAARFVGPALAGLVIVGYGAGYAFLANAVSYLPFIAALFMIRPRADLAPRKSRGGIFVQMVEGYSYSLKHPGIGPTLVLMMVACICLRPVFELLPGYAAEIFERGAEGLSMMATVTGIGAVVGGIYLGQRAGLEGLVQLSLVSVAAMIAALLVFSLTSNFWVGLAALSVAGGAMVTHGAGSQTLIQSAVDEHMRGRVIALYGMMFRGGPAIGSLTMGWVSDWAGLRLPLIVGCGLTVIALGWMVLRRNAIRDALEARGGISP
ncbi:MFS transporter [Nisaea acidiphila]|uniref:MFS transporter n=1 Tax=Nisaea acidiphila TaxID=1862145 RepID=A0A9J7AWF5_9PROT|nr:MFS transporter [Nisaea acidiphila]UUX51632.1 MFS transporter [Nisaea acidiphila]